MATPTPSTSPPALDYAPAPPARRRLARRVLRWWSAWLLLITVVLGVAYGPRVWRRYQLLKLQEACLTAEIPQDRPLWEQDLIAARALIAARPGEYVLDPFEGAVRVDPRWAALAAELNAGPWPGDLPGEARATAFCHERFTPDGRRRLVVVEWPEHATVVEPAGWFGGGPRVVRREEVRSDEWSEKVLYTTYRLYNYQLGGGALDPADRSRFTVPFAVFGVAGTFEYRLMDDDRVTMRLLDPDGFGARLAAAKVAQQAKADVAWEREIPATVRARLEAAMAKVRAQTRSATPPAPPEGK